MVPPRIRLSNNRRGSAAVEAALVMLPFFAMLYAIIDYSVVFFIQGTFKHAAREGVRFAITQRGLGSMTPSQSIKKVVQDHSMGFLSGSSGLEKISIRFYNPTTHAQVTGPGMNAAGNIVEVTISPCERPDGRDCFRWGWMAPLQAEPGGNSGRSNPMVIRARSSDLMEAPRGGILPVF
jgi:hypothetical protein